MLLQLYQKIADFTRNVKAYYILVGSIVILTIAIQSIIQYSLKQQRSMGLIVNMAGRQRMLSQRILNNLYGCQYDNCNYADLRLSLTKLNSVNNYLINGNEALGFKPLKDEQILANFDKLEPHLIWFNTNLDDFGTLNEVDIQTARFHADGFLRIMNEIVGQFQKQSEKSIQGMMIVELELAVFSLLIVFFEIFFIVRPVLKNLVRQKKKLQEVAWHQSRVYNTHIKNTKDLQYVLKAEKNVDRQKEIISFIVEELDALEEVSKNMENTIKKTEKPEDLPHQQFLQKFDAFLAKMDLIKYEKLNRDDKVHSLESKKHGTTAP